MKIGDPCYRKIGDPGRCVGPENCIWMHCYFVKKYKEKLGMLYYEYTMTATPVKMFLVLCHCGHPPTVKYGESDGVWKGEHWRAKCSNSHCGRDVGAKTEKEACEKWNNKYDWYVHELSSVFSEEEYTKMVEECGGCIISTPHWEEGKKKPCKHCELRERIKKSVIKELGLDENLCSSELSAES